MGYSKLSPVVLNQFKLRNKMDETKTIVVLNRREVSYFWNNIIMGISDELNACGASCSLTLSASRMRRTRPSAGFAGRHQRNYYFKRIFKRVYKPDNEAEYSGCVL